jgi:ethanolamine transporter EutH
VTKASSNGADGNEAGIIVGALFGGLFVVVVAILIAVLYHRHREEKK